MPVDTDRRNKQYLFFRLLIILLGFGLVSFYQLSVGPVFRENAFAFLYALLGLYLVLGVGLFLLYPRWRGRHGILRWQVVADFVIQAILVWGTGGVLSIFSPLLFVTLFAATSVISSRGAFVLATLATVFLTATTLAYSFGIAPVNPNRLDWLFGREPSVFLVSYLLASVAALFTVSTLGSRFSHGLRRMEGIQSEILENMAEGLIAVDRDGQVLRLNREARQLLGLAEGESRYRKLSLDALLPGEALRALRDAFQQDRRRRLTAVVGAAAGGQTRPVEVKISSVPDDGGGTRCRIGLLSDLSLKREMEAAERRIQKLEDLQVMALGIAHEIRNPLASIRGCIQEISRIERQDPVARRFMEIVCRESDRLDKIIEDFLLYARSGPVDLIPLDLVDVLEEASVLIKSRPDFPRRALSFAHAPERPRIFGDRNRLIQIFLNLGINAIQATSPHDGKISLSLRSKRFTTMRSGASDRDLVPGVEVEFADNGSGIRAADFKKLFTPFFTTKESGSGLGLCIVERIVREHMGHVNFSSVEGQGTTFRLWFPVINTVSPRVEDAAGAPAAQQVESCALS
jgi:two-component system sensor histidine kinase PilS (NtrC family)